jgi:acyl-CoA thioesterase-1
MRPAFTSLTFVLALAAVSSIACQTGESGQIDQPRADVAPAAEPDRPKIVALGDSLTAGLGIPVDQAYPAVLQDRIDEAGYDFEIVNAGVSGDTTAGGLRRVDWVLEGDVRILILALGANDGLRGLPVAEMRRNLSTMIERARARGIAVLLTGMEAPPNLGSSYTSKFRDVFSELAREYDVAFLPFLLEEVAGERRLNQRDGIHPNANGARVIAENIWRSLQPMLESASAP